MEGDAYYGRCGICGRSWREVKSFLIRSADNHSMFPVCVECYEAAPFETVRQRIVDLAREWAAGDPLELPEIQAQMNQAIGWVRRDKELLRRPRYLSIICGECNSPDVVFSPFDGNTRVKCSACGKETAGLWCRVTALVDSAPEIVTGKRS